MGRKFDLKKEALHYLSEIKRGSRVSQQERRRMIIAVIEDLAEIHELPPRLSSLSEVQIVKLVNHWLQQGIAQSTISNRLGAIRRLSDLSSIKNSAASDRVLEEV